MALEKNSAGAGAAIRLLRNAKQAAKGVIAADFAAQNIDGPALGAAIEAGQIERIAAVL